MSAKSTLLAKMGATNDAILNYNGLFSAKDTPALEKVTKAADDVKEALDAEVEATFLAFFEEHKTDENPVAEILRAGKCLIPTVKKIRNDAGVIVRMERGEQKESPINPVTLTDWLIDEGILGDTAWMMASARLEAMLTLKAMRELDAKQDSIDAVRKLPYVDQLILAEELGEASITATQAVKLLQGAIDALVYLPVEKKSKDGRVGTVNAVKARSIDVKFLESVVLTADRKNRIKPVKAEMFYRLVAHVCHCILSGEKYEFNANGLKEDKLTAGRHFQIIRYAPVDGSME